MKLRPQPEQPDYDKAVAAAPVDDTRTVFVKSKPELAPAVAKLGRGNLLLPYQQHAIKAANDNSVLVIEKSRRIGLTWGMAAHAVLTAAARKTAGGMDVFYMGYEKEMAREFIDTCGMWAKAFGMAAGEAEEFVFDDDDKPEKAIKAFRIQFASGYEIVALPSKPRAFRGKQGLVILDEAAFMDEVQESIDAALALLIWGGSLIVISTHYGTDNAFNKLIVDIRGGRKSGEVLTITFADAMRDGLYERVALVAPKKILPKAEWEADIRAKYGEAATQELDCIPTQGGASWLDPKMFTACVHPDAGKPELYQKGNTFLGYDVARRRDGIIQVALEEVDNILWERELWAKVNVTFRAQRENYGRMIREYKVLAAGVDQTGMGEPQVEALQDDFGTTLVHGYILSGPQRLALAIMLREEVEAGTIRFDDTAETRADLLALKRAGPDGKALMEGPIHADRFWAFAIAVAEARGVQIQYGYTPVNGPGANDDDDFDNPWGTHEGGGGRTAHGLTRGGTY